MNPRRARVIAVPAIAILAAVVLAACGGSSSPTTTTSSSTAAANATPAAGAPAASAAATERRAKLATCLKKYGVTLPTGGFGGAGRFGGATGAGGFRRPAGATGAGGARRFFGATGARGFAPGGGGAFGATNSKFAQALAKCGGFGAGGFGGGGGGFGRFGASGASGARGLNPATDPQYRAEIVSYAACMKADGVDLPTPNFSGKGFVFGTKVNEKSSSFIAANAKCQGLIKQTTPSSGT
jgi:hypothetical protein